MKRSGMSRSKGLQRSALGGDLCQRKKRKAWADFFELWARCMLWRKNDNSNKIPHVQLPKKAFTVQPSHIPQASGAHASCPTAQDNERLELTAQQQRSCSIQQVMDLFTLRGVAILQEDFSQLIPWSRDGGLWLRAGWCWI